MEEPLATHDTDVAPATVDVEVLAVSGTDSVVSQPEGGRSGLRMPDADAVAVFGAEGVPFP